ncbi:diguanylate cyclase [Colwellia sp. MB3u-70]|uniref:diguanylate cyclase domain-containing protein n=1 Tax=unclassified Colwellia TaxID=196834 RepID=UPI0015F57DC8|nr:MULTISPECIES: diguanylate cyclase [unclassified Colwellia]MBA6292956.1 diguanylate cyclase [Colwellia sp. MB3u-8]MBA6306537.1 diguanylate cyclase [Colwellia sp. MB3u-70]
MIIITKELSSHTPMSLLLFDLDYFKRINDTWGHEIGDRLLQKISTEHNLPCEKTMVSVALALKSSWWFYLILH